MYANPAALFFNRGRRAETAYTLASDELDDAQKYIELGTPEALNIGKEELRHAGYWIAMVVDAEQRKWLQKRHDELAEELNKIETPPL